MVPKTTYVPLDKTRPHGSILSNLSRILRKPALFIYENKGTDQLCVSCVVTAQLISAFVFTTLVVQSLYFQNLLSIFYGCTALVILDLLRNLKDRLSCDAAHGDYSFQDGKQNLLGFQSFFVLFHNKIAQQIPIYMYIKIIYLVCKYRQTDRQLFFSSPEPKAHKVSL